MKIGIATLFAPSNYGNALQMLSLQRYLAGMGHEVETIRHWLSPKCEELNYYHNRIRSKRGKLRFLMDVLSFGGAWSNFVRETRISKWLEKHYRFSELSGGDSDFPTDRMQYDCLIAGSDQIWNPKYPWPEFNLFRDVDSGIRRVAYAASFGTDDKSLFDIQRFVPALAKFAAISMREPSGNRIVNEVFHLRSELVCDPTLLHTRDQWLDLLELKHTTSVRDQYVVYLVTPDFRVHWRTLVRLARELKRPVHFYAFSSYGAGTVRGLSLMRALLVTVKNVAKIFVLRISGVHMHMKATPADFVAKLDQSKGLFTDSFHGLMFATIFSKECNVRIGTNPDRVLMSARLRDFTADFGNSEMLTGDFCVSGLRVAEVTPKLNELIAFSKLWLHNVLKEA